MFFVELTGQGMLGEGRPSMLTRKESEWPVQEKLKTTTY